MHSGPVEKASSILLCRRIGKIGFASDFNSILSKLASVLRTIWTGSGVQFFSHFNIDQDRGDETSAYNLVPIRDLVKCTPVLISSRNEQDVRAVAAIGHAILI